MNPTKLVQKLTDEIINYFQLPRTIYYRYIRRRIVWSFVAGWELGKKRTGKRANAIIQLNEYGKILRIYAGYREAAKAVDGHARSIENVVKGKRHNYKGYYWKVINDLEGIDRLLEQWQKEL